MEETLLHLPYFGPISHFIQVFRSPMVVFENEDNYQKQTYRNRMYIYGANGRLALTIPVKHLQTSGVKRHQKYRDIKVENDFKWQQHHWKSLKSAYQTSPFFEFYEDDLAPLYHQEVEYLMDFNYLCFYRLCECLQLDITFKKTSEYIKNPSNIRDMRGLINAKTPIALTPYPQVFETKKGFISNLSILDLLFNEGPNSLSFLQQGE